MTDMVSISDQTTIIVHWRGPFTLDAVLASDEENGLYLLTGKLRYQRLEEIHYCGITQGKYRNRLSHHHKAYEIKRDQEVWLGAIAYPETTTRRHLEIADQIIIYFWQPSLNERKRYTPPRPTTLISQWFHRDGQVRIRKQRLLRDLYDVLSWDGAYWRTGNLSVWQEAY
jgi:hypothetical protein